MALFGWHNCPGAVRAQVDQLTSTLSNLLAEHLIGIYLHGSLAMGCFNPHHSDLDLLVITTTRMSLTTKRQIIEYLHGRLRRWRRGPSRAPRQHTLELTC